MSHFPAGLGSPFAMGSAVVAVISGLALFQGSVADAAPGQARPSRQPASGDAMDVEDVEDVAPVTDLARAPTAPRHAAKGGLVRVLPRFHAAIVHFPIAWLVLLLLIDIRTVAWRRPGWERLGLYVLGLTLASMILAAGTGLLRAEQLPPSPDTAALIIAHRNLALIATLVTATAFVLRLARRNKLLGAWRWIYLGLLAAAAGFVLLAGHRGAVLVFGPSFLSP